MKQKMFTAFLGGLFGILFGAYTFYTTGQHHFWLVPLGTFSGCLIGFSLFNFVRIRNNAFSYLTKFNLRINFLFLITLYNSFQKMIKSIISLKKSFNIEVKWHLKYLKENFISPWGPTINWFKKHPMNGYIFQEFLITSLILLVTAYFVYTEIITLGLTELKASSLNGETKQGFSVVFALICSLVIIGYGIPMYAHIYTRSKLSYYKDFEIYSRYKIFGVISRILGRFLYQIIIFTSIISLLITGIISFIFYAIATFMLTLFFFGVFSLIQYVSEFMKKKQELSTLIISLIITSISYFAYRQHFNNQLLIWIIAFLTGSMSAIGLNIFFILASHLKITKIYNFFNLDNVAIDDEDSYVNNMIGIILFIPAKYLINKYDDYNEQVYRIYQDKFA